MSVHKLKNGVFSLTAISLALVSTNVFSMSQRVGSWEYSADAPWRLEPTVDYSGNVVSYSSIPINITINDARASTYTPECGWSQYEHSFCSEPEPRRIVSVQVIEKSDNQVPIANTTYAANDFFSIERTLKSWLPTTVEKNDRFPMGEGFDQVGQTLCLKSENQCVNNVDNLLEDTSEWHGIVFYQPETNTPGSTVHLEVVVTALFGDGETRTLRTYLKSHLGEKPLPKFSSQWAYGDLHYHSQGTDNTGESGYSYRETFHAMNAIGLDFVIATDHANNTEQVSQIEFDPLDPGAMLEDYYGLSDMSAARWKNHWNLLNGQESNITTGFEGVNVSDELIHPDAQQGRISGFSGSLGYPQIILGGELDVIPEVGVEAVDRYGPYVGEVPNGLMSLLGLCGDFPGGSILPNPCGWEDLLEPTGDGNYLVKDLQGALAVKNARQHMVYLPRNPYRDNAGITSDTNRSGGASRRLRDVLQDELGTQQKGYTFLAHPTDYATGSGFGRLGPDIMPYADSQLEVAFNSPYVLGFESWNENSHFWSEMDDGSSVTTDWYNYDDNTLTYDPYYASWNTDARYQFKSSKWTEILAGIELWDYVQAWSLDAQKAAPLSWLDVDEPRRMFLSGGSDAHGDFNHRRLGYAKGTKEISDTKIGSPRNLVYVGSKEGPEHSVPDAPFPRTARAFGQQQIVEGIKSGNFSVTDGPAIRIAIDMNDNGIIDDADIPMGGFHTVPHMSTATEINLLVEWKTTPEFGRGEYIYIWLGAYDDESNTYARYIPWSPTRYEKDYTGQFRWGGDGLIKPEHEVYRRTWNWENWQYDYAKVLGYREKAIGYGGLAYDRREHIAYSSWNNGLRVMSGSYEGTRSIKLKAGDFPTSFEFAADTNPETGEIVYYITSSTTPDRMFIRAEIETVPPESCPSDNKLRDECIRRVAFSNPVWVVESGWKEN